MELKAGVIVTPHDEGICFNRGSDVIAVTERETEFYLKSEADAEIRRLQRALYIARAKRALEKIAWFKLWNASISTMNPEDGARQEYDKWKKSLGKFLKKAEDNSP